MSEKAITAADANRRFSEILRLVRSGRTVVVTSHGKPVAKVIPAAENEAVALRARSVLFERLRKQRTTNIPRWTRDELYD
jgi:prevent-host-death family protein